MRLNTTHSAFTRRVVVYYLLFSLAAIALLGAGFFFAAKAALETRMDNSCLAQLNRISTALALEHLQSGPAGLQEIVESSDRRGPFLYCAVVSPDGRYLAHTSRDLLGREAQEPTGDRFETGEIQGVRFTEPSNQRVREYRTTLKSAERTIGVVRIGFSDPTFWQAIGASGDYSLVAIIGPLVLVSAGAVVLYRMVRPISQFDAQLRQMAAAESASDVELSHVDVRGGGAFGWNRLVDELHSRRDRASLDERISSAVQSLGQQNSDDILNSIADGVAVTDERGRITFANTAFATLISSAADRGAVLGADLAGLLGDGVEAQRLMNGSQQRDRASIAEISRNSGGSERVLRVARRPFRASGANSRPGDVWSVRDVTQQKLSEKMRDQFLDSATHELRTPLANIKAYAETLTLSEMMDVEQQKEFCNTINIEATRLGRLIDDLLSISSMELGSLSVTRQNVDMERMLQEVAVKVRPVMEQKKITFETVYPDKLPQIKLDKDKFTAALVNLLGNAAKYTPSGGRVSFRVKWDDKQLAFDVADTGVGISAEELPKVFDKFFRSADARVRNENGTGLGLSLAQEIIRLHGGELSVQSELNKGSTFTVTVPIG